MVAMALLVGSVTGVWMFPSLWPELWTLDAWYRVGQSSATLLNSLNLGFCSSAFSLILVVMWLECTPLRWRPRAQALAYLPLIIPNLLWVILLYALMTSIGLEPSWWTVCIGHITLVFPYMLIALSPAYGGFDARYEQVAASFGHRRWRFLIRIKWPMLKSSILSSASVGFAVSVAQYLPTLYLGGGRIETVTTEAVTLASSGQRSLTSSYALLQFALPMMVFFLAHHLGRARRF
jgi:putative thiamine transport system permease protein